MFISGTSTVPTPSAGMHRLRRAHAHEAYLCCLSFVDSETGREETKVRLWWHEHWQTRYSSSETEKEVDMPTQTPLLQQVRTKIATLPRNIRSSRPRSKPPRIEVAKQLGSTHVRYRDCLRHLSNPDALTCPTTVVGIVGILGKQVELVAVATLGLLYWRSTPREGEEPQPRIRCVCLLMSWLSKVDIR